ncbi:MAG TPA: hypothetical protein VNY05_01230 [Candidatus Acidoferrales bacterium]|nr:hypothetical protein [Candidatus Acidoferrales bacterium]
MMTRRTFTGTIIPAVAGAAGEKLNLGIGTYTYHSLSIDSMIVQLKRLRIREMVFWLRELRFSDFANSGGTTRLPEASCGEACLRTPRPSRDLMTVGGYRIDDAN